MSTTTISILVIGFIILFLALTLIPGRRYDNVVEYFVMLRLGLNKDFAWDHAGMSSVGDRAVGVLCSILGVFAVLYLLSDYANAAVIDVRNDREAYVAALEKIVTACISDSTGRPVIIDGEWFLCGIVPVR